MERRKIVPRRFIGFFINVDEFELLWAVAARERLSWSQFLREETRAYADHLLRQSHAKTLREVKD